MSRALVATLLVLPAAASAAPAEGRIEAEDTRIEILGKPVRVGETVRLPEGFIRVEEAGTEDQSVGSFTVVPADAFRSTAAPAAGVDAEAAATGPAPRAGARRSAAVCRGEKAAYLRELWRTSGIDVPDPGAILEGLEAGAEGPDAGFYWFALATDPFRPLSWSSELRSRADALARCVRANGT